MSIRRRTLLPLPLLAAPFVLPRTIPPYYDAHAWAISTWWASPANK